MKVSVIATVLNNGDTVGQLLDSIFAQSRKPNEVIVVDGGSKDNTIEVLKEYEEKHANFKFYTHRLNKAQSRNFGIDKAKYSIIAQIDGSCKAQKHWLKRLIRPLSDEEVGVSAGFYKIVARTAVSKAVTPYIGITQKMFDHRSYMPTGRSMAIRKHVWAELQGYSEDLQWSGEDNLFNYKLLKKGIKIARTPDALVYWYAPKTLKDVYGKIFSYTAGIAQTGTWNHPCESLATVNTNVFSVYAKWFVGLVFLALSAYSMFFVYITILGFTMYTFSALWSKREQVEDQEALMFVPLIQIISDIAVMAGFASGIIIPEGRHKRLRTAQT